MQIGRDNVKVILDDGEPDRVFFDGIGLKEELVHEVFGFFFDPEGICEVRLGVEIQKEYVVSERREAVADVCYGGGLGDSPFVVQEDADAFFLVDGSFGIEHF